MPRHKEAVTLFVQRERDSSRSALKYIGGREPAQGSRLKVYDLKNDMVYVSTNGGQSVFWAEALNGDIYFVGEKMSLVGVEKKCLNSA